MAKSYHGLTAANVNLPWRPTLRGHDLNQDVLHFRIDGRHADDYVLKNEFRLQWPALSALFAYKEAPFKLHEGALLRVTRHAPRARGVVGNKGAVGGQAMTGEVFFEGVIKAVFTGLAYQRFYAKDTRG